MLNVRFFLSLIASSCVLLVFHSDLRYACVIVSKGKQNNSFCKIIRRNYCLSPKRETMLKAQTYTRLHVGLYSCLSSGRGLYDPLNLDGS